MIAIAIAAVFLTGARAMPPWQTWREGYVLWQGLRQARTDVEIAKTGSGTGSAVYQRAILNRRVSELQFSLILREAFPDPIGSACVGAVCLSAAGAALALPAWCVMVIRRRMVFDAGIRSCCGNSCHDQ
jgi:hypothetical protein